MSIICKCLRKFKNKSGVYDSYEIVDTTGNKRIVRADSLKQAIKNKDVTVVNLKLTSDNRIISVKESVKNSTNNIIEAYIIEISNLVFNVLNGSKYSDNPGMRPRIHYENSINSYDYYKAINILDKFDILNKDLITEDMRVLDYIICNLINGILIDVDKVINNIDRDFDYDHMDIEEDEGTKCNDHKVELWYDNGEEQISVIINNEDVDLLNISYYINCDGEENEDKIGIDLQCLYRDSISSTNMLNEYVKIINKLRKHLYKLLDNK